MALKMTTHTKQTPAIQTPRQTKTRPTKNVDYMLKNKLTADKRK